MKAPAYGIEFAVGDRHEPADGSPMDLLLAYAPVPRAKSAREVPPLAGSLGELCGRGVDRVSNVTTPGRVDPTQPAWK